MKIHPPTDKIYEDEYSENIFLDTLIHQKQEIDVYLLGGVRLNGHIIGHDEFSLVIFNVKEGCEQLIYKHSILSVQISSKKDQNLFNKKNHWERN